MILTVSQNSFCLISEVELSLFSLWNTSMNVKQTFLDKTMQGSVCSKVAVKGLPTKNGGKGGKKKNPWETNSDESKCG